MFTENVQQPAANLWGIVYVVRSYGGFNYFRLHDYDIIVVFLFTTTPKQLDGVASRIELVFQRIQEDSSRNMYNSLDLRNIFKNYHNNDKVKNLVYYLGYIGESSYLIIPLKHGQKLHEMERTSNLL